MANCIYRATFDVQDGREAPEVFEDETGATLSSWRDAFLEGGLGALRARQADDRDEHIRVLEQRLGRMVVENELQREQVKRLKEGLPLDPRRSRR